jgi:hypothetical protein
MLNRQACKVPLLLLEPGLITINDEHFLLVGAIFSMLQDALLLRRSYCAAIT